MKEMLTSREKAVVLAMCQNDLSVSRASRAMHYHRNTVVYHLGNIKKKTELDCQRFYDALALLNMVHQQEAMGDRKERKKP